MFPPRPGPACGWCDFRAHCPEGRRPRLQRRPWDGLAARGTRTWSHVTGRAGLADAGRAVLRRRMRLGRVPERGERAGRGLRGLDRGRVRGPGNAHPLRAQPLAIWSWIVRRPGVVVLAVQHQHRRAARARPARRSGPGQPAAPRPSRQARRAAAPSSRVAQEVDDSAGHPSAPRPAAPAGCPRPGRSRSRRAASGDPRLQLGEQGPERPAARGPVSAPGPEPSSVSEQNPAAWGEQPPARAISPPKEWPSRCTPRGLRRLTSGGSHRDHGRRRPARSSAYPPGSAAAGALVLPAHVDRDHPAARPRPAARARQEVFLAAGIAGDQQGGLPLADPAGGQRLQRGEGPAAGLDRDLPTPSGSRSVRGVLTGCQPTQPRPADQPSDASALASGASHLPIPAAPPPASHRCRSIPGCLHGRAARAGRHRRPR